MENIERKVKMKPTKIEEMTKDQIREVIAKKRECNAKAQVIVESLLDKGVNEVYFLQCLADINQCHFDDIIEERAITSLCGYPICTENISEKDIPKQKYRISVKTNKVYDITTRKSFCSNHCYKSAMYVKKQMLTSPLWFREYEDVPIFHLLPLNTVGSLGQEVDLAIIQRVGVKSGPTLFTSINEFTSASLNEISEQQENDAECGNDSSIKVTDMKNKVSNSIEIHKEESNLQSDATGSLQKDISMDNLNNAVECININKNENDTKHPKLNKINSADVKEKKLDSNPLNIVGDVVEKPEQKIDPILTDKPATDNKSLCKQSYVQKPTQKKKHSVTIITIEVEKCLAEWFTLDTLLFLFGEEKVKEMVVDKGECLKEYLNNYAKGIFYSSNTYDQYQALCRKLNMLELEDRRSDSQTMQRETKPLPDYSLLQEESKNMQLKVKAFLSGDTQIPEADRSKVDGVIDDQSKMTQLPLIDKNAQNALRRRIVCEHLNKVLPDLLRSLGLLTLSISSDVRLIVNTFKLKANNIMFKPIQWILIAIVIIKLLSLRDRRLQHMLESPTAYQHMQLLLLSYKQDGGYLERLLSWLTDIDRLLDTNDTQLTIES